MASHDYVVIQAAVAAIKLRLNGAGKKTSPVPALVLAEIEQIERRQREVSAAEREQQAAAAQKKAKDQKRHAIESFLGALDAQGRADIDRQFGDWLASHNQNHVLTIFRRSGITESHMVFAQFAKFYDHHHQETA